MHCAAPHRPRTSCGVQRLPLACLAAGLRAAGLAAAFLPLAAAGAGLVAVLVAVGVYFLTRDYVSAGVVIFAAIVFGIFGSHKPRQLQYRLNHRGITIDKKHYSFNEYRSFSVIQEEAFSSITLMPLKRFAPPLSLYFAPEDEEQIINILSATLPFEERNRDAVDALMHRIRF